VAGEFVYVGNANGTPLLRGGANDTAAEPNSHARGLPLEGTQNQLPAFEQVETSPVHVGQRMENERRAIRHVRHRIGLAFGHGADPRRQLAIEVGFAEIADSGRGKHRLRTYTLAELQQRGAARQAATISSTTARNGSMSKGLVR
jgi:hypothetical protein